LHLSKVLGPKVILLYLGSYFTPKISAHPADVMPIDGAEVGNKLLEQAVMQSDLELKRSDEWAKGTAALEA
jgi:hypothetical protein